MGRRGDTWAPPSSKVGPEKEGGTCHGEGRGPHGADGELGRRSGGPLGEPPPHLGARGAGRAAASSERLCGPPLRALAALLSSQLRTGPWGGPGGPRAWAAPGHKALSGGLASSPAATKRNHQVTPLAPGLLPVSSQHRDPSPRSPVPSLTCSSGCLSPVENRAKKNIYKKKKKKKRKGAGEAGCAGLRLRCPQHQQNQRAGRARWEKRRCLAEPPCFGAGRARACRRVSAQDGG